MVIYSVFTLDYFIWKDITKMTLTDAEINERWIPVSDPPKHPNWVIAQDEQGNVFPATFRGLRWLDDEGDELPPYYPQIVKWCEMPKGE